MKYRLLCLSLSLVYSTGTVGSAALEDSSQNHMQRLPMSEMSTNPAIVLANHIRTYFHQDVFVPNPHASWFSQHWNGWIKSLLLALLISCFFSVVNNILTFIFSDIGFFKSQTQGSTTNIQNTLFYIMQMENFSCASNSTHLICSRPLLST